MIIFSLFYEFFKIGLFAIGGGLVTIPFLYDLATKTNWFSISDISDMIAISEITPGPLGVNMSTYTGFLTNGISGGIIATLGLVTPSIIIIIVVSKFLDKFRENKIVKKVFYGLRAGVISLILIAGLNILKEAMVTLNSSTRIIGISMFIIFLLLLQKTKIHPIWLVLSSGIVGGILYL